MGEPPSRILVVEDHRDTARVLALLLRRDGYAVRTAKTYAEALALGKSERFDLALCDIVLPDGDGCDLLRELRSIQPIKAIAITGLGMPQDFTRCREAGFAVHVLKPMDYGQLVPWIEAVLDGRADPNRFTTVMGNHVCTS